MPLIEQVIPHLLGGLSEQPTYLSSPTHSKQQHNTLPLLSRGLLKRPPSRHLATLSLAAPLTEHAFVSFIDIGHPDKYILLIDNNDLFLWNAQGQALLLNFPDGKAYLQGQRFALLPLEGCLYILNKDKVVRMSNVADAGRPYEALIFVKQAVAQISYQLSVTYGATTVQSSITTAAQERSTSNIAQLLKNDLSGKLPANLFTFELQGSTFKISSATQDFKVTAKDGYGDQALEAFKDTTQNFQNLPAKAFVGFTLEIATDPETKHDSFYVTYTDKGVWKETVKPGLQNTFDASTLPHKLFLNPQNVFTFSQEEWGKRCAGDNETCPSPSFVDHPLSDMFFYQNRLGFLSHDAVILSEVDEYTNFWPTTTATVLEGDSIDISIPYQRPVDLHHAVALNNGHLLLFSKTDQFLLKGDDITSPRTLRATVLSHYNCDPDLKPMAFNQGVLFGAGTKEGYLPKLRELIPIEGENQRFTSEDITAHVPRFIYFPVKKLVHHAGLGCVFVLKKRLSIMLEVYTYHWKDDVKIQSAWSQWIFHHPIVNLEVDGKELVLITYSGDGLHLEKIDFNILYHKYLGPQVPPSLYLDRYVERIPGIYDPVSNTTLWALPYMPPHDLITRESFITMATFGQHRRIYDLTPYDTPNQGSFVSLPGDFSQTPVAFGERYRMRYEFGTITLKDMGHQGSAISEPNGHLFLRHLNLSFENTGAFEAIIKQKGRVTGTYRFTPREGFTEPSGVFRIPLMGKNHDLTITLKSDSLEPCAFQNAAWTGLYTTDSRRV